MTLGAVQFWGSDTSSSLWGSKMVYINGLTGCQEDACKSGAFGPHRRRVVQTLSSDIFTDI